MVRPSPTTIWPSSAHGYLVRPRLRARREMSNAPAEKGPVLVRPPGGAMLLSFLAALVLFGISCGAMSLSGAGDDPADPGNGVSEQETTAPDPAFDEFERATLGGNWGDFFGNPGIVGNQDLGLISRDFVWIAWTGSAFSANQFSEAVISPNQAPTMLNQVFVRRRGGDGARYAFHYDADLDQPQPEWQIKYDGVPTPDTRIVSQFQSSDRDLRVQYVSSDHPPPQLGDTLRIEVWGTSPVEIRGYHNGVLILAATDTAPQRITGNGRPGMAFRWRKNAAGGKDRGPYPAPAFAGWSGGSISSPSRDGTISVNAETIFQTMDGFGSSQRLFRDPHLIGGADDDYGPDNGLQMTTTEENEVLDRLHVDLGLTRMRLGIFPVEIEPVNDNNDPEVTDLSKFNFEWKRGDGFLDYVTRARARGLTTWWHSPVNLESWMNESNPEEYVEWAMAFLRRWRDQGLEMPYYSIMNEPGYRRGGIWSGEYIRDVIKILGPKLRAEGFSTMIVIPDDLNSTHAARRAQIILADPVARQYVGAIAFHLYDEPISNAIKMKQLSNQYGIPLWMTEWSQKDAFDWANTMHELISAYDVGAIDYLFGFTGQAAPSRGRLIRLNNGGTQYLGNAPEKRYYTMGQYSRFVKPGAQRVEATSADTSIKVTAYVDGPDFVAVVINNANWDKTVQFDIQGISGLTDVRPTRTSHSENWAELSIIPVIGSSFMAALAGRSVTTFVGSIAARQRNKPPLVNAGIDLAITLPGSARLEGSVTNDGLPGGPVTTTWSKISGPGTVTLGDKNAINTTARFSEAGTYDLRLTASDGDLSPSDEVTIRVNPLPPEAAPTRTPAPATTPTPEAIPSPTPAPTPSPTPIPEPGVRPDPTAREPQMVTPAPEPSLVREPTPAPESPPTQALVRASVSEGAAASGDAASTYGTAAGGASRPGVIVGGVLVGVFVVAAGASYVYLRRRRR